MNARHEAEIGQLSKDELRLVPDSAGARQHYEYIYQLAIKARKELLAALNDGIPRHVPGSLAGKDAAHVVKHGRIRELITTFVWANRALWSAADALCMAEGLEDEGRAEGVEWEALL